jgi:hypothetical protein
MGYPPMRPYGIAHTDSGTAMSASTRSAAPCHAATYWLNHSVVSMWPASGSSSAR